MLLVAYGNTDAVCFSSRTSPHLLGYVRGLSAQAASKSVFAFECLLLQPQL